MSRLPTLPLPVVANSVVTGIRPYSLDNIIDSTFIETQASPIDLFITNAIELNKLLQPGLSQVMANLIILGYVSAIESYFRAVGRRIVLLDDIARASCEKKQVNYGSALNRDKDMLPEALFEGSSLTGKKNVTNMLKEYLGFSGLHDTALPPDLNENLDRYSEICELRHCIVHRFGKFGSHNAITLGLSKYIYHIEKPINCDFNTLQEIVAVCHNTVKIMNNFLFERILNRLIINDKGKKIVDSIWNWNYSSDKYKFSKYFDIFYCVQNPPATALTAKGLYDEYRNHYRALPSLP